MAQLIKEVQLDVGIKNKLNTSLKIRQTGISYHKGDKVLFISENNMCICTAKNDGIVSDKDDSECVSGLAIGDFFTDGEVAFVVDHIYSNSGGNSSGGGESEVIVDINNCWDLLNIKNPSENVTYRITNDSSYPIDFVQQCISERNIKKEDFTPDLTDDEYFAMNMVFDYGSKETKELNEPNKITYANSLYDKNGKKAPHYGYLVLEKNGDCIYYVEIEYDNYDETYAQKLARGLGCAMGINSDKVSYMEDPCLDWQQQTYPLDGRELKWQAKPFEKISKIDKSYNDQCKYFHWKISKEDGNLEDEWGNLAETLGKEEPVKIKMYLFEYDLPNKQLPYDFTSDLYNTTASLQDLLKKYNIDSEIQEVADIYLSINPISINIIKDNSNGVVLSDKNNLQHGFYRAGSEFKFINGKFEEKTYFNSGKQLVIGAKESLIKSFDGLNAEGIDAIVSNESNYCFPMAAQANDCNNLTGTITGTNIIIKPEGDCTETIIYHNYPVGNIVSEKLTPTIRWDIMKNQMILQNSFAMLPCESVDYDTFAYFLEADDDNNAYRFQKPRIILANGKELSVYFGGSAYKEKLASVKTFKCKKPLYQVILENLLTYNYNEMVVSGNFTDIFPNARTFNEMPRGEYTEDIFITDDYIKEIELVIGLRNVFAPTATNKITLIKDISKIEYVGTNEIAQSDPYMYMAYKNQTFDNNKKYFLFATYENDYGLYTKIEKANVQGFSDYTAYFQSLEWLTVLTSTPNGTYTEPEDWDYSPAITTEKKFELQNKEDTILRFLVDNMGEGVSVTPCKGFMFGYVVNDDISTFTPVVYRRLTKYPVF